VSHESTCSVCSRLTGFGDEDRFEPPVNLARCPAPGGLECRAVAQAVAPLRRENEVLRSNSDHLSSENASLVSQVDSMARRIESLAEELAKPEDVRLREVVAALDGHAVIFDGLGARVGHLLDEMDEWIARAGESERLADERLAHANQLQADIEAESRASCSKADPASEDEESDIVVAGRQVPFVQVGMIVHPDDCLNCERDGNPLWCSALVCDIHDDETARFGMMKWSDGVGHIGDAFMVHTDHRSDITGDEWCEAGLYVGLGCGPVRTWQAETMRDLRRKVEADLPEALAKLVAVGQAAERVLRGEP
jgi:hypothetical protein